MIRVVLGTALTVLGFGAGSTLSPYLLAEPRGEPLVMVTPDDPAFQAASYESGPCGKALLLASPAHADSTDFNAQVMAFALGIDSGHVAVVVRSHSDAASVSESFVLLFDSDGRLTSADTTASLDAAIGDCLATPEGPQEPQEPI